MSSFKCAHYYYKDGHYCCELIERRNTSNKYNYLSTLDLERWCWNENAYLSCPYR